MIKKYPFKNLIFKGGGMKALAYHGVILELEEQNIMSQIERVAGTSAGSLLSTLLSMRLSAEKIIDLYKSVDYSKVAGVRSDFIPEDQKRTDRFFDRGLTRVLDGLDAVNRFVHNYGWYENDYPHEWLQEVIAQHCNGNGRATFKEFRNRGYRDLYIVATNISLHQVVIFSADSSPDVSVADAVLMSSSLPFFFEAVQFDGKELGSGEYFGDGGLLVNYPLNIFDDKKYKENNKHYTHGINWETLGCRLFTPEDSLQPPKPIHNLISYIENVLESIAEVQETVYKNRIVDQLRTINVNNCGISATDFRFKPEVDNTTYTEMLSTGKLAVSEYLENYKLPTDRLFDIKAKFIEYLENIR